MVLIVLAWTVFGLYFAFLLANVYINRSETRRAWRKHFVRRVLFRVFDVTDWFSEKVLRREPWEPPARTPEREEQAVIEYLATYGVRAVYTTDDDGVRQLMTHAEDRENFNNLLERAK